MMVIAELEAALTGRLPERIEPGAEALPLLIVHHVLMRAGENGDVCLSLYGIALLGNIDTVRADGGEEVQFSLKVREILLKRFCQQEGGEPAARDAHAAQVQFPLQLGGILRVLVADLTAGKTRKRHFAHGLAEGILRAEFRHIVVAPADRGDAKLNLFRVK